jgi:3-demethoxyubiquinol 3-hydroxylase
MLNLDNLIIEFDKSLRTLFARAPTARPYPDANIIEAEMSEAEKKHAAALMHITHTGEICAQALYQGQALTARDPLVQQTEWTPSGGRYIWCAKHGALRESAT